MSYFLMNVVWFYVTAEWGPIFISVKRRYTLPYHPKQHKKRKKRKKRRKKLEWPEDLSISLRRSRNSTFSVVRNWYLLPWHKKKKKGWSNRVFELKCNFLFDLIHKRKQFGHRNLHVQIWVICSFIATREPRRMLYKGF